MMKKQLLLVVSALSLSLATFAQDYLPSAERIQKTVNYLAADKLQGRGTGTKGGKKASEFVKKQFKALGLQPGNGNTYFQDFKFDKKTHTNLPSRNVIAYLDNHAANTIIIGAHYDHLGKGELFDGRYPNEIHNGADDNASGVAGLLELARYYKQNNITEQFNFLFIAFGGEELGLHGSKYFTENPTIALNTVSFMLNMDMIGRYNPERGIGIGGYATALEWPAIFKDVQQDGIKYFTDGSGKGASDHHNFYMKNIPVMFLHTGGHDDYHKPTDDAPKLQATSEAGILNLAISLMNKAMAYPKLTFTSSEK
ncbi:M20/M25/M40 family metallo-hydrolase [Chitinophaga skermanii]|nr:M20/M25/M40 family metallo-hydrolase [Chitinophaga skermanii]